VAGFEREVALKLVHAHLRGDEESRLHLLEEARLAARIRHPNVVPVTEVDADACGVFLVMDYVEGESLSGLVRLLRDQNQRLSPRLIARIMNDALAGLHAAHELRDTQGQLVGLVHRDFSPQNILLGIEGVTRLADFGVAKAASRTVRTKTGLVKGKVAYMSPEQARGHKVDRRCDVWAAGVVVWELLTGRKLYDHEDDVATLLSVVTEEPARLSSVMQGVPRALDEAVSYALTSPVNNRCPSAEAFRCMLESAWDECGGMATTPELGAFVRQTVGQRLAERRALVARGRSSSIPQTAHLEANSAPPLPTPGTSPQQPEDGTKTAISAAVPAAEQKNVLRSSRLSRRSMGVAAVVSLSVLAAILGLAVRKPEEPTPRAVVDRATGLTSPKTGVPAKPAAGGIDDLTPPGSIGGNSVSVNSMLAPSKSPATQRATLEEPSLDGTTGSSAETSRKARASARSKAAAHKARSKANARSGSIGARAPKATTTAPHDATPPPAEREPRSKTPPPAPGPAPLHLAPDPYASDH
jgi:eukaryotic-like serine/threonine-protein kinase